MACTLRRLALMLAPVEVEDHCGLSPFWATPVCPYGSQLLNLNITQSVPSDTIDLAVKLARRNRSLEGLFMLAKNLQLG